MVAARLFERFEQTVLRFGGGGMRIGYDGDTKPAFISCNTGLLDKLAHVLNRDGFLFRGINLYIGVAAGKNTPAGRTIKTGLLSSLA